MEKNELLKAIKAVASQNLVSKDELIAAYNEGIAGHKSEKTSFDISKILYFIGGGIIILGIVILIFTNWDKMNDFGKILASLGSAIAAYILGAILSRYEKIIYAAGQAFFFISAILMPIGFYVTLDIAGFDVDAAGVNAFVSASLVLIYVISYFVYKTYLFNILAIAAFSWLYFSLTSLIADNNPILDAEKFFEYRTLVLGLSFLFLGYYYSKIDKKVFSNMLYAFGMCGVFITALILGGYKPDQNMFWEIIYPGLIFAAIFISVYLKNKIFLFGGSIFLITYIIKITGEYFSHGFGWAFSLVIAGLALMGVGYLTYYLHQKYLGSSEV
ncbi:MAG: hypothetical protein US89_C0005G0065 [Candidatus Peregrinibacteria bacterium GW2011_GWF2_38_29]|nr:MAG: hypothetical protein US89_C0005G0065 [Candidatus Peregrinibacteria bacterium GW2011_GWF2_38_29]HBB02652.1 hypothetical protein [Candidatus Peregrinibacteria bacterium]